MKDLSENIKKLDFKKHLETTIQQFDNFNQEDYFKINNALASSLTDMNPSINVLNKVYQKIKERKYVELDTFEVLSIKNDIKHFKWSVERAINEIEAYNYPTQLNVIILSYFNDCIYKLEECILKLDFIFDIIDRKLIPIKFSKPEKQTPVDFKKIKITASSFTTSVGLHLLKDAGYFYDFRNGEPFNKEFAKTLNATFECVKQNGKAYGQEYLFSTLSKVNGPANITRANQQKHSLLSELDKAFDNFQKANDRLKNFRFIPIKSVN
ncbi:hypothetical protein FRY74_06110 [Vicingus serpentipes]|uniref:Uncharacterized protein n=1 Tax=Vicingus serpentipes TaxID=1926625 RepID=A0A5C6RVB0_9FLAO|nr:hypothetical protein [Vicingus serpentipes]TXB66143.1 hypothetical protein FRY74_06110 [Vicingus serpentipes]